MAYRKKIISAGPLVKEIIYPYRSGGSSSNGRRRTGTSSEHSADDLITKVTAVSPSDVGMDIWLEAVNSFFCGEAELIEYVQQIVGLAHLIRGVTKLLPHTFADLALIVQRLESMPVQQVRIIEHAMQVRVLFINVDCQQELVLIVQKFLAYLLADFECPFRSDLTGLEADDKVLCEDGASA